ncbi:MAG: hypothetical protein LV479_11235 [Methylacidiphilales bacterium]|nr:hypothetical protein [Candidatus Methylacidiphilales bacterium]
MSERLLCYKEAASEYGVHYCTIKKWVRDGKVKTEVLPSGRKLVHAPKCTPIEDETDKARRYDEDMHTCVFLNATRLARRLDVAPATLARFISRGKVTHDAVDVAGHPLFALHRLPEIEVAIKSCRKPGEILS